MSVTCKPSWRTARAPYWEVVFRGSSVCVLHIKPFFLLVRPHPLWVASKGIGRGKGSGRRENAADKAGRRWQTGVTGNQTDYVGRTSAYYATPTINRCGCPGDVFFCALVFLSFPSAFGRTLFSRTAVLFCLPHPRGGTTPLSLFIYYYFSSVSLSLSFFSLLSHLDC